MKTIDLDENSSSKEKIDRTNQVKQDRIDNPPTSYVSLLENCQSLSDFDLNEFDVESSSWSTTFNRIRQWSSRTFRIIVQQRFQTIEKSEDPQIDLNIRLLKQTRIHYQNLVDQTKRIYSNFQSIIELQRNLEESLNQIQNISVQSDDLSDEIVRNRECQKVLIKQGELLLNSLKIFINKIETFISVIMEDTFRTIKIYENARDDYDYYRHDYQMFVNRHNQRSTSTNESTLLLIRQYQQSQDNYQRIKQTLTVKMKYLDEHRIQTIKVQLHQIHQSIVQYFSLNRQQLNI